MSRGLVARVAFESSRISTGALFAVLAILKFTHRPPGHVSEVSSLHLLASRPAVYYAVAAAELTASVMIAARVRVGFWLGVVLTLSFAAVVATEAMTGAFLDRCGCFGAFRVEWRTRVVIVTANVVLAVVGLWTFDEARELRTSK